MNRMNKLLSFLPAIILIAFWGAGYVMGNRTAPVPVSAQSTEQCQYPTRPLVNGNCDNSDPCDPTTIKDPVLHGDCAEPTPVTEPSNNITVPEPVKPATPVEGSCGK